MTTLIIARHGNTFEDGETPRRVGARTDLPLTDKGRAQARAIGRWLKKNGFTPDAVFCSNLKRTVETAEIATREAGSTSPIRRDAMFNEIDYGPDENKTDAEVVMRIGAQALKDWDEKTIVPPGWEADPRAIVENWISFGSRIRADNPDSTVLAVTSNGIARFAPHLTGDFPGFLKNHKIKIATGAVCVLKSGCDDRWLVEGWNVRP